MQHTVQQQQQACSRACFCESALDAWLGCLPQGYSADVGRVAASLPGILAHVLECSPRQNIDDVRELFEAPQLGAEATFMRLLRPAGGRVHFLRFWRAFGEVACLAGARPSEGVQSEIETLRDEILRRVEGEAPSASGGTAEGAVAGVRFLALLDEVHRAAAMSSSPRFWQRVAASLADRSPAEHVPLDEVAGAMLAWVTEGAFGGAGGRGEAGEAGCFGGSCASECIINEGGLPVLLHIYDVSCHEGIQRLNRLLAFEHSPLKFGGVFHAGVEVNGLEWSFSYSPSRTRPGVSCFTPMKHPHHHYRETVYCGRTQLGFARICRIISDMLEEYPGQDYHLLRRNCCHFADDLLLRLGLQGIPAWVHRLSRLGANIDSAIRAAQAVKDAVTVGCIGGSEERHARRSRAQRVHRSEHGRLGSRRAAEPRAVPWHTARHEAAVALDREMGVFGRVALAPDAARSPDAESSATHTPGLAARPRRGKSGRPGREIRTDAC